MYVIFPGRVTEQEKVSLMQQAWIFVNPSLKEGWGMTNIEAAACGTG
ncbi:MAG: glycosyltransferase [Patescibacteria group bacterium]|nr:glycosyltransferase [Patescibacteria group bacterium]